MKVFIFGAGASLGVQDQEKFKSGHPQKAPLIDELFDKQYKPSWFNLVSFDLGKYKKQSESKGVEEYLTQKWDEINNYKTERAKTAALSEFGIVSIYLWDVLNRVSQSFPQAQGYTRFLEKYKDEDFGILTFNYDTLLDQSYQNVFGKPLAKPEDYLREKFIKLHGSVNWFLKRDGETPFKYKHHRDDLKVILKEMSHHMFNGGPLYVQKIHPFYPGQDVLTSLEKFLASNKDDRMYPLIFVPLTSKMYEVVANFRDVFIQKALEIIKEADSIFLIGYQAKDELIHELLGAAPADAQVYVIGKGSAVSVLDRVIDNNRHLKRGTTYDDGFEKYIESL